MIGVGIGVGIARFTPAVVAGGSNPNLLVFPEAFDNAAWVKAATVVTPDAGDATHPTADLLTMSGVGSGVVTQASDTAATVGAGGFIGVALAEGWERGAATATFDGLPYTWSCAVRTDTHPGSSVGFRLFRSGGFIAVQLADLDGDDPTFLVWGAKLEQAAAFSNYP